MEFALGVAVLDTGRFEAVAVSEEDPLDGRIRPQVQLADRGGCMDVGVHRALARVGRAPLEAGPALHAVDVGVGVHGLELMAQLPEAGVDRADALGPVGSLADSEHALDALVVRAQRLRPKGLSVVAEQAGGVMPLVELEVVRAKGDLGIHRRRASDAAATEDRDDAARAAVDHRHAQGPPEVMGRLRLPADEVGGGQMGSGLEQDDLAVALRQLAGDHTAPGTRADHDDVAAFAHPAIPR